MRFIYLTLTNLHTNTCRDLHSRAGTKMLARSTRLPPHPNTKRESGDETSLELEGCDADSLLLQVKSEEWPDEWVDLRAQDEIEDRILVKAEKLEVRYVKISGQ